MGEVVCFTEFVKNRSFECINICGPLNAGKTSLLNAVRQYNMCSTDDREEDRRDKHFIVSLDFSDYSGKSYDVWLTYIRKKLSDLYVSLYDKVEDELRAYRTMESYINIVEGISGEDELRTSLDCMIRYLRWGNWNDEFFLRPLVIIDEVSRPVLYGAEYGYVDEIKNFMHYYLEIDHYELTAGIITTSYSPANVDVNYDFRYIRNVPVNEIEPLNSICALNGIDLTATRKDRYCIGGIRYFDIDVSLKACFKSMALEEGNRGPTGEDYKISFSEELSEFVREKRQWIQKAKEAEAETNRVRKERERIEYAENLASDVVIPSHFAGVRNLNISAGNRDRHEALNTILKDIFDKYGNDVDSREVYYYIQGISGCSSNRKEISNTLRDILEYAESKKCFYHCWIDVDDSFWAKFDLQRDETKVGMGDLALVKVYMSVADPSEVLHIFDDAVRYLIDKGRHLFHAKISKRNRKDHICLWISREDFFLLEQYVQKYGDALEKPLDFVAYRGNLGVSRELYSWNSHNGIQSKLISIYLSGVKARDDIDVIDMYAQYVKAWNGELDDDNAFSKEFKKGNAQELIILLESLNTILGNACLDSDNILLSGDGGLWNMLGQSKNWHDVSDEWRRKEGRYK